MLGYVREVRSAYHVLHDINTQRTRIVGHWNPDAETNQHNYGRDAKDEHIFLAMSEKVYGLAHDMDQRRIKLTEPEGSG